MDSDSVSFREAAEKLVEGLVRLAGDRLDLIQLECHGALQRLLRQGVRLALVGLLALTGWVVLTVGIVLVGALVVPASVAALGIGLMYTMAAGLLWRKLQRQLAPSQAWAHPDIPARVASPDAWTDPLGKPSGKLEGSVQ